MAVQLKGPHVVRLRIGSVAPGVSWAYFCCRCRGPTLFCICGLLWCCEWQHEPDHAEPVWYAADFSHGEAHPSAVRASFGCCIGVNCHVLRLLLPPVGVPFHPLHLALPWVVSAVPFCGLQRTSCRAVPVRFFGALQASLMSALRPSRVRFLCVIDCLSVHLSL